jgi:site-specific recombinase XerD
MGISPALVDLPPWLQSFLDRLAAEDLSAATRRGYRYDLLQFAAWYAALYGTPPDLPRLTEHDVIAWRQHMIARRQLKATTINRRLEAVRRLLRWAEATGAVAANVAAGVRTIRLTGDRQPVGLTAAEVHGLLRAAGESSHGLARRNYALVQLMLQTGLRIGEVAALRRADITVRERAGALRVRHGKGLKDREVPLNATARRALRQVFERDPAPARPEEPVFRSTCGEPLPVRSIQNTIAGLVRRAGLKRAGISAHSLRHTFALAWLRQHPGKLVELAQLLGHESLDTTAVYTRASTEDLARDVEQTAFNLDG